MLSDYASSSLDLDLDKKAINMIKNYQIDLHSKGNGLWTFQAKLPMKH